MSSFFIEIPENLSSCSEWFNIMDWKTMIDLGKLEYECDSCKFYNTCLLAQNKGKIITLYK